MPPVKVLTSCQISSSDRTHFLLAPTLDEVQPNLKSGSINAITATTTWLSGLTTSAHRPRKSLPLRGSWLPYHHTTALLRLRCCTSLATPQALAAPVSSTIWQQIPLAYNLIPESSTRRAFSFSSLMALSLPWR